jgi:hypothetical protein
MLVILSDIHSNPQTLAFALDNLAKGNITDIYCTSALVEFPWTANRVIGFARIFGYLIIRV